MIGVCPCCRQPFETSRVTVSLDTNELSHGGEVVKLTRRQAEIAFMLAKSSPRYVPRERLFCSVQGSLADDTKAIEVHIGTIRKKIDRAGLRIENMRGIGYRIVGAAV